MNPDHSAEYVPPEVALDLCGRQVLAKDDHGRPFRRYVLCDKGCGFLIGCGDAIESVYHLSCGLRADAALIDGYPLSESDEGLADA